MSPFFIALTITTVLMLAVMLASWIPWWGKLAVLVLALGFNFLAWSSANSGRGWPVPEALPANAQFVNCTIIEPDEVHGITGVIYVEMIPLDIKHGVLSYRPRVGEPRLYREPYDRSLHIACEQAKQASAQGIPATIRKGKPTKRKGTQLNPGQYHAYVLPSPHLPRKGSS